MTTLHMSHDPKIDSEQMPYLHFEFQEARKKMSETIKKFRPVAHSESFSEVSPNASEDEIFIQAYLDNAMSLHPRRTLDQSLYRGFDTEERDNDQVVYRYCKDTGWPLKIFMCDQLFLFVFGKGASARTCSECPLCV